MLTSVGLATARRLHVGGAQSIYRTTRVALRISSQSAVVVPSGIRIAAIFKRGFAAARTARAPKAAAVVKTTKKTTTTTTTKKPKKKTTAASAKKKTTTKKAKKAAPKAKKPKTVKKKVALTDEQKQKLKIKKLREVALLSDQPTGLPSRTWPVFLSNHLKENTGKVNLTKDATELGARYKQLSAADLAALDAIAKRNKAANDLALASWVASKSVEEIAAANRARVKLRKLGVKAKSRLVDPRHVPKALTGFALFTKARWASGEFAGFKTPEATRAISQEWKGLSAAERESYLHPSEAV
ncbi:hypothetical protein QBC35DRAFT_483078 [Podospora australis]|uniref:HMG box domain-containing protein n=1 Tax=Podospora australis TaxID=1536484 RepID=A0AAN7AMM7_9PEZI|nr:hypothetical protein QBC35DRAFT_483078 [Podospora australis]